MASLDLAAMLPRSVWDRIAPIWNGKWRTAVLAGAGLAAALAALAILWSSWASSYSVLFAGLSEEEGGRAIAELQKLNIPYRIAEGGRLILVPTADVGRARLQLAVSGIPKGDGDQWALLDNERLGVSPFVEQVDYVRALEATLARTIRQVDGVLSARVRLALPKETDFLANSPKPSASVMLRLRPGLHLTATQVEGIADLVAASVPGLTREHVKVVDQEGRVLNPDGADELNQVPQQLAIARDIEQRYETAVTDLLAPVLGRGNFRVSVDADLDFSKSKESEITYGNGHVLSQDQRVRPVFPGEPAIGIPGALSNRPPPTPVTNPSRQPPGRTVPRPPEKPTPPPLDRHEVTNYDIDRTVQYVEHPVWTVRALHVAVAINDPLGRPMPAARLKAIDTLVRSVIGVSRNRQVAVVALPFERSGAAVGTTAARWWDAQWAAAVVHNTLLALAGLLVLFGGVFPVLGRLRAGTAPVFPSGAEPAAGVRLATMPVPLDATGGRPAVKPPAAQNMLGADVESVRMLAINDPARAAQIIKEWIARDGSRFRQAD